MTEDEFDRKREHIRQEFLKFQSIVSDLRNQMEVMDREKNQKTRQKMLGKCFRQNCGSIENPSWMGYVRIDGFDEQLNPMGIVIDPYIYMINSERRKTVRIEINHRLFDDWILNGKEIRLKKFNRILNDVKNML